VASNENVGVNLILKVENLGHSFGKFQVLENINLSVKKGVITALIGPNGAGKTTFYNVISGKYQPTEGKVFFKNMDITKLPAYKIVDLGLARSFQVTNIFPNLTVIENILIPLILHNKKSFSVFKSLKKDSKLFQKAENILDKISLSQFRDRKASELSYGDKRLIEIGIVLSREPEMILLDEPTAGMNPEETNKMIEMIKELADKFNTTFFITEHDMKVVFSLASYIYVLHQGCLLAQGAPDEIKENHLVKEAYLGGSIDTVGK
jgi:branched-chain amino acid transport system ATP-binding protein